MCGIVGLVSQREDREDIVRCMNEKIIHRGPDGEGVHVDDHVALAHRRLSIIDLSNGRQPMYNEDQSIVIVYNGEVYNFPELREQLQDKHDFKTNCDTEVLVHGYEEWGTKLTQYLRGMFAFAIWDCHKHELFIARDGFGIKPLYYLKNGDDFVFASEIKAILEYPDYQKELNKEILAPYLCFNSTPTKETFFKNIFRVEPGHQILYKDGQIIDERYFHLEFDETNEPIDESVEKIRAAMEESVEKHMISDVEVGSFLSSGIDSSYLVSLSRPDKTYTVGYDDPRYDEIAYAQDLTQKLGITNRAKKITKEEYIQAFPQIMYYMDEPLADPSAIALYFVAQIASQDLKVVMSGEGADELFGGYLHYQEEVDQAWYMKIPYPMRRLISSIAGLFPEARGFNFLYRRGRKLEDYHIGLGRVFRDKEAQQIVNDKHQLHTKDIVAHIYADYQENSTMVKRQAIDFYYWLINDFLHAVDRNTMMFSLEARVPFLDKAVYEVARHLPTSSKVNMQTTKPALRKAASTAIPNEAYKKKKLGFPVPLREWIREDDLYGMIKEKFDSDVAKELFDHQKITKLLENHKSCKQDCYKKVWTIYTFLVWYEQFFGSLSHA